MGCSGSLGGNLRKPLSRIRANSLGPTGRYKVVVAGGLSDNASHVRRTPRISCERPVPAEWRARGVPLRRVDPWGRSEGDRQLHPLVRRPAAGIFRGEAPSGARSSSSIRWLEARPVTSIVWSL